MLTEAPSSAHAPRDRARKVAYRVCGRPRTILEAAAARGFATVSGPILEQVLRAIKAQKANQRSKRDTVLAVVQAFRSTWKWSDVAVAKCLLAGTADRKPYSRKQEDVTGDEEHLAQMSKHAAAEAALAAAKADPGQALVEAVVAYRNPEQQRSSKGRRVKVLL